MTEVGVSHGMELPPYKGAKGTQYRHQRATAAKRSLILHELSAWRNDGEAI
jgi:hypothetical protein